ncbi:adenosine deaminase [Glaciecola sp. 1036]|uniref:adenosine deaminase n=1 Tax=Alteromonadaceae TaxID=72275 RepID=UPI003CFF6D5F
MNAYLPRIELHRHLDGNVRPSTILELAKEQGTAFAKYSPEQIEKLVYIEDKTSDLLAFLKKLDYGISILQSPKNCYRIAWENVEDAYSEGLDYVELRFSPFYMAQPHHLNMHEVIEQVIAGVRDATHKFDVKVNLIGILSRTFGVENCNKELDAILDSAQHFVAVDLAGDEAGFPANLFQSHFKRVHDKGLKATIHAGEAAGPESVWDAIKLLGASRIGHGVKAIQDKKLMGYLAENQIGIESCITSNYQTGTWIDIATHPVKEFLSAGIEVSLHTDDPGVSNVTLTSEFELAKTTLGLSENQLTQLQKNALAQAYISSQEKIELIKKAELRNL